MLLVGDLRLHTTRVDVDRSFRTYIAPTAKIPATLHFVLLFICSVQTMAIGNRPRIQSPAQLMAENAYSESTTTCGSRQEPVPPVYWVQKYVDG